MEWKVPKRVDDDIMRDFMQQQLFLRFATANGGLWTCFHRDGASTLLFADPGETAHTCMFGGSLESRLIYGTTRPLAALSMAECLLFQRTFLRNIDSTIHDLIVNMQRRSGIDSASTLKTVHSLLLRFRAEFATKPVSSSSACEKQFAQWASVAMIASTRDRLDEVVKDLHTYFADISGEKTQRRINGLTIVLGFLGLAQLTCSIYVGYLGDSRRETIWVQVLMSFIILLSGLFVYIFLS